METKLNDNEVREIVKMQQKIDSYEGFICALNRMMISEKDVCVPIFTDTYLDKEMSRILRWVKEHKDNK